MLKQKVFIVDGRTDAKWLARRTREAMAGGQTVVWRAPWRGYGPAKRAAGLLEADGFRRVPGHIPGGRETLWAWRPSGAPTIEVVPFHVPLSPEELAAANEELSLSLEEWEKRYGP
jgi:hypothetical protein